MGQPTLEAQLKNAIAELKRLEDPATLGAARAKVDDLRARMDRKAIREARSAALARARGPGEDELLEAKVVGLLMAFAGSLGNPKSAQFARRKLVDLGLSEADADQRLELEIAMDTAVPTS